MFRVGIVCLLLDGDSRVGDIYHHPYSSCGYSESLRDTFDRNWAAALSDKPRHADFGPPTSAEEDPISVIDWYILAVKIDGSFWVVSSDIEL